MPRHPPTALTNLNQHKTNQRCSHPLYSYQTTTKKTPQDPQGPTGVPSEPQQCAPPPQNAEAGNVPSSDGQQKILLRKEVIQPHLPVRLPCYDFVPIASPTFDSSPPKGLGHWLRVLPTFVT